MSHGTSDSRLLLRRYLTGGVDADPAVRYRSGHCCPCDWAFPDFRDGRYDAELATIGHRLLEQRRRPRSQVEDCLTARHRQTVSCSPDDNMSRSRYDTREEGESQRKELVTLRAMSRHLVPSTNRRLFVTVSPGSGRGSGPGLSPMTPDLEYKPAGPALVDHIGRRTRVL